LPALAVRTRGSYESPFTWSSLVLRLALTLAIFCCGASTVCLPRVASAGIEMPIGETAAPVKIRGDSATNMTQGQYQVWIVRGNVELKQDDVVASADEAVFWVDRA
jgi:lipopolysaccharide export system protein LptA